MHFTEDQILAIDKLAEKEGRSRKNWCEYNILMILAGEDQRAMYSPSTRADPPGSPTPDTRNITPRSPSPSTTQQIDALKRVPAGDYQHVPLPVLNTADVPAPASAALLRTRRLKEQKHRDQLAHKPSNLEALEQGRSDLKKDKSVLDIEIYVELLTSYNELIDSLEFQ